MAEPQSPDPHERIFEVLRLIPGSAENPIYPMITGTWRGVELAQVHVDSSIVLDNPEHDPLAELGASELMVLRARSLVICPSITVDFYLGQVADASSRVVVAREESESSSGSCV